MTFNELKVDIVILACAISAGIHAGLAPAHFEEGAAAGVAFVVAAVALGVLAALLTRDPSEPALLATGVVLAGSILSYLLAITTGVPLLHPERESVEALALCTKAVEVVGLLCAIVCLERPEGARLHRLRGVSA